MKQVFLKVYDSGKTTANASVLNFDRENNTGEIVVDFSQVGYTDWIKQLDLVLADGTHTFIEGSGNTLTVPLLESYLKFGTMTVQPVAKRLVGVAYEKVKWQIVSLSVRDSLNVLEDDTSITPSIAEQWEIRIDAVEDAELIRISNENTRITNENTRISSENIRLSNEVIREDNEDTRIASEIIRLASEITRNSAEDIRLASETTRGSNEVTRVSSEQGRVTSENSRVSAENTRLSNESTRVSNENTRVSSENARNVFVAYNSATSYVVGNKVSYLGSSYQCILASLGNLPTNSTYWLLIAQKGDNTSASSVTNTPSGNISSTTVQGAINELDTEKAPTVHTHDDRYYTETEVNTLLNTKANITQEAWITPTLLNGWTGVAGQMPFYMKDQFGFVHVVGTVTGGTSLSPIMTFPNGYKTLSTRSFATSANNAFARVSALTGGSIAHSFGSNINVYLDCIIYKAEA